MLAINFTTLLVHPFSVSLSFLLVCVFLLVGLRLQVVLDMNVPSLNIWSNTLFTLPKINTN